MRNIDKNPLSRPRRANMPALFNGPRPAVLWGLAWITPAGFLCKWYSGPAGWWLNDYAAGLVYEVFWILVLFFIWPYRRLVGHIGLGVLIGTCVLEGLQLWHPWFLTLIRSTFLGRALIGTTFSWWDFPHYLVGSLIGWGWIRHLAARGEDAI